MIKKIYNFIKEKLLYFLIGGVVLASGGAMLPETVMQQMEGKTATERAEIKSLEIAKLSIPKYTKGDFEVEIIGDITQIEINGSHGIEFLAKAWKGGKQLGFINGTVEIERFRFYNPPVLVDDPNGEIIREWTDEKGELKQRKLKYDPTQALKNSLAHTIGLIAKDGKDIIKGKVGNTTSTFYPDASPESTSVDGYTRRRVAAGELWAGMHDNAGEAAADDTISVPAIYIKAYSDVDEWYQIYRSFFLFDTSAIGSGQQVDSAILSLYGKSERELDNIGAAINIYGATPNANTAIIASDYQQAGTTEFSTEKTITEETADNAYNDFTLNANGKSNVAMEGVSKFSTRESNFDAPNIEPTWDSAAEAYFYCWAADQTGTANDPKLVVVHSGVSERRIIFIQ